MIEILGDFECRRCGEISISTEDGDEPDSRFMWEHYGELDLGNNDFRDVWSLCGPCAAKLLVFFGEAEESEPIKGKEP